MDTLVIVNGAYEYEQARGMYRGQDNVRIKDVSKVRQYLRGEVYKEIIFSKWCQRTRAFETHAAPGVAYQLEKGANVTCLGS